MSYREYITESVNLPSFVARKIVSLQFEQQDKLEDYVNEYCFDHNYLECGVESFRAYSGTILLRTNLTEEEKQDSIAIVCIVIEKWFETQGSSII